MLRLLKYLGKGLSHIAGAIVGAITGIAGGFIHLGTCCADVPMDIATPFIYIFGIIGLVPFNILRGSWEGLKGGFKAGLFYPRDLLLTYNTEQLCKDLKNNINKEDNLKDSFLLSKEEKEAFSTILDSLTNDKYRDQLQREYKEYETIVNSQLSIANKKIQDFKKPVIVKTSDEKITLVEEESIVAAIKNKTNNEYLKMANSDLLKIQVNNIPLEIRLKDTCFLNCRGENSDSANTFKKLQKFVNTARNLTWDYVQSKQSYDTITRQFNLNNNNRKVSEEKKSDIVVPMTPSIEDETPSTIVNLNDDTPVRRRHSI